MGYPYYFRKPPIDCDSHPKTASKPKNRLNRCPSWIHRFVRVPDSGCCHPLTTMAMEIPDVQMIVDLIYVSDMFLCCWILFTRGQWFQQIDPKFIKQVMDHQNSEIQKNQDKTIFKEKTNPSVPSSTSGKLTVFELETIIFDR